MSLFLCPSCGAPLLQEDRRYVCGRGHSFDRAAEGYVNLLPANQKHSKAPGDDREMVAGRAAFLRRGYYAPLRDALTAAAVRYAPSPCVILDSGCGEGYYTSAVLEALHRAEKSPQMAAIDISKWAAKRAAKQARGAECAVASAYRLPLAAESCDLLINCFSPLALEEFRRVLKPGGVLLYVVPAARHLYEMKQVLYDAPYENEEKLTPYEGFSYQEVQAVTDTIILQGGEDIANLLAMTPYAWKTGREGKERLLARNTLSTQIDFRIHIFRKD